MKKNRLFNLSSLILVILAVFTFTSINAQEVKEEKKIIKIKMTSDEDGNVTMDTTIVLSEDFDGDWDDLIEDEDIRKQIEEIEIDLDIDKLGNSYLIKSSPTTKKGYFYTVDVDDEGEVKVMVEQMMDDVQNIQVKTIEGDTTMTFVVKCIEAEDDGENKVMVWHSDDNAKHKIHSKENIMISQSADVQIDVEDGDTVITYTIKMDGDADTKNNVIVWSSDGKEEMTHDIIIEKMEGDSNIMIVTASGGAAHAKAHSSGKVIMKTVEIETDEDGNIVKKVITSDGDDMYFGGENIEIMELKDHDGAMVFISKIMISDADNSEKEMLKEGGIKMGKDPLILNGLKVSQGPHNHNLKLEFTARELNNLSIALLDENGKQLFLEELRTFKGKYIREIELPDGAKGDFFLHIVSGRESLTKKINLD